MYIQYFLPINPATPSDPRGYALGLAGAPS
jgi:hypothetical protein